MPIVNEMPSNEYHSKANSFSSSQLKDMLDDPEFFHKKYILKEIEREEIPAFSVGTYFHTAVLEPHKIKDECAVFKGVRRGKEWDLFKEENKNKAIITETEWDQATKLVEAVKKSSRAMGRIERGRPEVSAFIEVYVSGSSIYANEDESWYTLTPDGFYRTSKMNVSKMTKITLKARADLLGDGYILDLKSTSGNAKSKFSMMQKVSYYNYDLSAALYLDIFSVATGMPHSEFLWTFASKDMFNSKTYLASADNISVGRAKWREAVLNLAECIDKNWEFEDSIGILEPQAFEREWIRPQGKDLL